MRWLTEGAFIYFDYKYDIVAINAVCLEDGSAPGAKDGKAGSVAEEGVGGREGQGQGQMARKSVHKATWALNFGESSDLPRASLERLNQLGRWWPVTAQVCQKSPVVAPKEPCTPLKEAL